MSMIKIKRFDPKRLEELAEEQAKIYNTAIAKLPDFSSPAKVEDVIKRFKRKEFDKKRMFYAYDGTRMIGYAGLTGKDKKNNLRSVGYPWLVNGADPSVRNLLYAEMEKQCRKERTKVLRAFGSPLYPELLNFYKSQGFAVTIEFLVYEKTLKKNQYTLPAGYSIRTLNREDLPVLQEVAKHDPKLKSPFVISDWEQFMNSSDYDPDQTIVAEKDKQVVGYYSIFVPRDPAVKKAFFGGVAVHQDHQIIEPFLLLELENRTLVKGKEILQTTFYPDSARLPLAKEQGFIQTSQSYQLEKILS